MQKRILAALLAIVLIICSGTIGVFAEGENTEDTGTQTEQETPTTWDAGKVTGFTALSSYYSVVLEWTAVSGAKEYVIEWTGNGQSGTFRPGTKTTVTHKVELDQVYTYTIYAVNNEGIKSPEVTIQGEAVRGMYLEVTVKQNKTLKSKDREKVPYTIKKGEKITTVGFTSGKYVFKKEVKGKVRTYHVMKIRVTKPRIKQIYRDGSKKEAMQKYSVREAELYVNARGVKSSKKYMIWVNQYTQRLYIFKGSKGKWKCIKGPWEVASGKPSSPTFVGQTMIKYRERSNGAPYWNICNYFSLHGNAKKWGALKWPKSGACVRNTNKHAEYIYKKLPMRTAVVVF